MSTPITPDNLNAVMEFDHVIIVEEGGIVHTEQTGEHAPDLLDGELSDSAWSLLNGYSGQYGYSGPIMHPSEFVGGRMADDILSAPGFYVVIADYPGDGEEPDGWAVAFKPVPTDCERGKHLPEQDEETGAIVSPPTCLICGDEGDSVLHKGHRLRLTGAWYCDTCDSPLCDLA